jgi:hypothetical protein
MTARVLVALIAGSLALAGCSRASGHDEAGPLTVVLFDVSGSTKDPAIRDRYQAAFEQVLDATVAERGTLVGDVIDDNPLAHSTYPIDGTFEACDPFTDNRLTCEARTTELRDRLWSAAEVVLAETSNTPGTDIRDAILLAERVFAAYPGSTDRSLVLLSDMVEHSTSRSGGAIPDLTGVHVYVVGAGVVSSSELPSARILAIQRFWLGYFAAANADLPQERYGAALVRFP